MFEDLEEQAYQLLKKVKRSTPIFLMRKLKLSGDCATKLHQKIMLRQHNEARKEAALLIDSAPNYGWDAQLDRVKMKNLQKFKGKKKKG